MTAARTAAPYRSGFCAAGRHDRCRGDFGTAVCDCPHHDEPTVVTTHCFYACGHAEEGTDPLAVHGAMERHYRDRHTPAAVRHCSSCTCPAPPHPPHPPRSPLPRVGPDGEHARRYCPVLIPMSDSGRVPSIERPPASACDGHRGPDGTTPATPTAKQTCH